MWMYGAAVAACHGFIYYSAARDREINEAHLREKLAQHEFQILKLRLHPHFLFNTLNGISALITEEPSRARTALAQLSDLLRMALTHSEQELISISAELDFVTSYLELQKMRLGDRLRFEIKVGEDLLATKVPNMILQPLVENAIRHGIEKSLQPVVVRIKVWRDGRTLCMEVKNPAPDSNGSTTGHGIGLSSVQTRLSSLYGDEALLLLERAFDGDMRVTVSVPLNTAASVAPEEVAR
jgi:two-component system, LytTR family, sensor kinase